MNRGLGRCRHWPDRCGLELRRRGAKGAGDAGITPLFYTAARCGPSYCWRCFFLVAAVQILPRGAVGIDSVDVRWAEMCGVFRVWCCCSPSDFSRCRDYCSGRHKW